MEISLLTSKPVCPPPLRLLCLPLPLRGNADSINFNDVFVDLSPLFNWNTKQLFLYVTAEYVTEANEFNQVVLWDQIVMRDTGADKISSMNIRCKYPFFDDGNGLRGNKNVSLAMHWNAIPNAGLLPRVAAGAVRFAFPDRY